MKLIIKLLGEVTVQRDETPITDFRSRKAEAILAYLALQKRPISRQELATLFWYDSNPTQATTNLRKMLHELRQQVGEWLTVTRQSVAFDLSSDHWVDVTSMVAGITAVSSSTDVLTRAQAQQLTDALAHYRGEFMAGLYVQGAPEFETWAALERERFGLLVHNSLQQLVTHHLHYGNVAAGIVQARRLINLDAYFEWAHRQLMRLLVRAGQFNAALTQYETCRQVLAQDLGVEPAYATTQLYHRVQAARQRLPHALPVPPTPFIGRETELATISQWLDATGGQLVTVVGLGGSGKTRLALEAAARRRGDYLHGIYFIPLTAVSRRDDMLADITDGIGLMLQGERSPYRQLLDYLREKEMLIILDNFEQLIEEGVAAIGDLLAQAPGVQLLITSRERLQLRAERVLWLGGLGTTDADTPVLDLFLSCAQRVQPDFHLTGDNQSLARQICQLVDGLPLGIELATAVLPYHSLAEIAAEIQQNLDFLATRQRDLPPRQRSLRAAFDYSWALLDSLDQRRYQQLAVFRSGFTAAAAQQVAGATLPVLRILVDKSMLQTGENGRYHIHELLNQYVAETISDRTGLQDRHARYFAALLADQEAAMRGADQPTVLPAIAREMDNIRVAWQWLVQRQQIDSLAAALDGLFAFCFRRSRYQEGRDLLQAALDGLPVPQYAFLRRRLHIRLAAFLHALADYDTAGVHLDTAAALPAPGPEVDARDVAVENGLLAQQRGLLAAAAGDFLAACQQFEASLELCPQDRGAFQMAYSLMQLVRPLSYLGQIDKARQYAKQSYALYREQGDIINMAHARFLIGLMAEKQGDMALAQTIMAEVLPLFEAVGNPLGLARTLGYLGNLAAWQEHYPEALTYYTEALALLRQTGALRAQAMELGNLGTIHHAMKAYQQARTCYEESLAMSQAIGDAIGTTYTLMNLGQLMQEQGDTVEARRYLGQALTVAVELQAIERILDVLASLALLEAVERKRPLALRLLQMVRQHPSCIEHIKVYTADVYEELKADADLLAAQDGVPLTLETAVALYFNEQ